MKRTTSTPVLALLALGVVYAPQLGDRVAVLWLARRAGSHPRDATRPVIDTELPQGAGLHFVNDDGRRSRALRRRWRVN